jgi:hypothetical protein
MGVNIIMADNPPTRKRVSQACKRCRLRKYKCDGVKPKCSVCISSKEFCVYETSTKKRGLPEGYVRGMEKLWGIAIRKITDAEGLLISVLNDTKDPLVQAWNDDSSGPLRVWRKSQLARELERHLPVFDAAREKGSKRKRHVRMSDSQDELASPIDETIPGFSERLERDLPIEDGPPIDPSLHSVQPPTRSTQVDSQKDRLPSCMGHLIDVYFSYTHSWFPILEKHRILRAAYQYSHQESDGEHSDLSLVLLWAIAAITCHQVSKSDERSKICELYTTSEFVSICYDRTKGLIPPEEGSFHIEHVQALLILVLLNIGHGEWSTAWFLTGKATRIAISSGLGDHWRSADLLSTGQRYSPRPLHVFWGCFVLDTITSSKMRRIPHLRTEDLKGIPLLNEDGIEEWDPWSDCLRIFPEMKPNLPVFSLSTFNQLIGLLKILNSQITRDIQDTTGASLGWETIKSLMAWNETQSSQLKFHYGSIDAQENRVILPHHYHLQFMYLLSLYLVREMMQSDLQDHIMAGDNTDSGAPLENPSLHAATLLHRQSQQYSLLLVPPTYTYILESLCTQSMMDSMADSRNGFLEVSLVWPGVNNGKSTSYSHRQQYTMDSRTLYDLSQTSPTALGIQSLTAGRDSLERRPVGRMQIESHLASNNGQLNGEGSSLSEMDMSSAFDELAAMDTFHW